MSSAPKVDTEREQNANVFGFTVFFHTGRPKDAGARGHARATKEAAGSCARVIDHSMSLMSLTSLSSSSEPI